MATYGRPGACYLDFPADMIQGVVNQAEVQHFASCPQPPAVLSDPENVTAAVDLLLTAKCPLVIVGKGETKDLMCSEHGSSQRMAVTSPSENTC